MSPAPESGNTSRRLRMPGMPQVYRQFARWVAPRRSIKEMTSQALDPLGHAEVARWRVVAQRSTVLCEARGATAARRREVVATGVSVVCSRRPELALLPPAKRY